MTSSPLITFYLDVSSSSSSNQRHRTLSTILKWSATQLENTHDYIQWLFPLPEASSMQYSAPLLTRDDFETFRSRRRGGRGKQLRWGVRNAFVLMAWFYGFDYWDERGEVPVGARLTKSPHYPTFSKHFNIPFDHNHLRITRMIRSLRLLGLPDLAEELYLALERICASEEGRVNARSREFWRRAKYRDLYLKPDLEDADVLVTEGIYAAGGGATRWLWEAVQAEKREKVNVPMANRGGEAMEVKDAKKLQENLLKVEEVEEVIAVRDDAKQGEERSNKLEKDVFIKEEDDEDIRPFSAIDWATTIENENGSVEGNRKRKHEEMEAEMDIEIKVKEK